MDYIAVASEISDDLESATARVQDLTDGLVGVPVEDPRWVIGNQVLAVFHYLGLAHTTLRQAEIQLRILDPPESA